MDRNEYLEIVSAQIRCKRAVPYLKEELEDHIEDQKEAYISGGMNPFEAEMAAVREMGDPVETGVQLDQVHKPKMEWKLIAGIVLMSLIGIWIQFLIAKGYAPNENFSWYIGVMSRQLIGIAVGSVIMLIVCFLDYSVLIKWSLPCWIVIQAVIIYLCLCGTLVNGRSYRAMHVAYFVIPFYVGLVYKFRNEKIKGLLKSLACLVVSVFTILMIPDMASAVTVAMSGLLIISIAVYKKWYNVDRKKILIGIWGSVTALGLYLGGVVWYKISLGDSSYKIERLKAWFNGDSWDFILGYIGEVVENVKVGITMEGTLFETVRNDYLWTYLFKYIGTGKGMVIVSFFLIFMMLLLKGVLKQKNRLGYMLGFGCTIYLCLQAFIYIGMNFKLVPLAGNYMPFFSNGITPMVVTYFYMGILLSIFRNSNIVRN